MSADRTRRTITSRDAAEAAFKAATAKPAELPPKPPTIPNAKELVSLRIDRDILDHFQRDESPHRSLLGEVHRPHTASAEHVEVDRQGGTLGPEERGDGRQLIAQFCRSRASHEQTELVAERQRLKRC